MIGISSKNPVLAAIGVVGCATVTGVGIMAFQLAAEATHLQRNAIKTVMNPTPGDAGFSEALRVSAGLDDSTLQKSYSLLTRQLIITRVMQAGVAIVGTAATVLSAIGLVNSLSDS